MSKEFVCAHTDYRFQILNRNDKCPYCGKRMNRITRQVWQGSINQYFHAEVELVCANPKCEFQNAKSWEEAFQIYQKKEAED